ncbi:MAG: hypothetical protein ABIA93_05310 [Candidatus Woesearchaeota archaeon]
MGSRILAESLQSDTSTLSDLESRLKKFLEAHPDYEGQAVSCRWLHLQNQRLYRDVREIAEEMKVRPAQLLRDLGYVTSKGNMTSEEMTATLRDAFYDRKWPMSLHALRHLPSTKPVAIRLSNEQRAIKLATGKSVSFNELVRKYIDIEGLRTLDVTPPAQDGHKVLGNVGERFAYLVLETARHFDPEAVRIGSGFRRSFPTPVSAVYRRELEDRTVYQRGEPFWSVQADARIDGGKRFEERRVIAEVKTGYQHLAESSRWTTKSIVQDIAGKYPDDPVWASEFTNARATGPDKMVAIIQSANGNMNGTRQELRERRWNVVTPTMFHTMLKRSLDILREKAPELPWQSSIPFDSYDTLWDAYITLKRHPHLIAHPNLTAYRIFLSGALDALLEELEGDNFSLATPLPDPIRRINVTKRMMELGVRVRDPIFDRTAIYDIQPATSRPYQGYPVLGFTVLHREGESWYSEQFMLRSPLDEEAALKWEKGVLRSIASTPRLVGHRIQTVDRAIRLNRFHAWRIRPVRRTLEDTAGYVNETLSERGALPGRSNDALTAYVTKVIGREEMELTPRTSEPETLYELITFGSMETIENVAQVRLNRALVTARVYQDMVRASRSS